MNNILEINNLVKHYPDFSLKSINFTLEKGYIMGFIGPNGSGKSTTIKLMMNLIKKDAGSIKIFGMDHEKHHMKVKDRIGFVYDENHFYEDLTVQEMKNIIRPFYTRWDDEIFHHYAKNFNLPLKKQIKTLSKGMKMKFSLAIALSHHADLLIMDEPTSGLDPLIRSELLEVMQSLLEDEQKSIFFSTHITSDLEKVADYITFIHNGEIILSRNKEEIFEDYCIIKGHHEHLPTKDDEHIIAVKQNAFGFEALARNKQAVLKKWGDAVLVEKPSLEELMVYYARRRDKKCSISLKKIY